MSEAEYRDWVLADYDAKRLAGRLSSELLSLTPANIKAEAIKVCERRFSSKDAPMLNSFVNEKADAASYRSALQICSADLFRPLVNFLEDRTINTKFKNIQLLAWLIDFQPRPFHHELKPRPENGLPKTPAPSVTDRSYPLPKTVPPEQPAPKKSRNKPWLIAAVLIIVCLTGFLLLYQKAHQSYTGNEHWMAWETDHFEPLEPGDPSPSVRYPINWPLVNNFKEITTPDTLTLYSVRKVYYAKYNGRVRFFTTNGPNVLDTRKRLLPMTDYILKKYVYHLSN